MDLTCYLHPSWTPRLRPASSKREWMDATPESYAYRCLPLAIANAHGWEIGSPCAFRARWHGGVSPDAVELEIDADVDVANRPVSLFGSGTITFHVEGLFRTSPGWNLWVGGPPNAAKDGLAALNGVIETDWSPYTFTMNWRFTRVGEWVSFAEDEPFCFLFPVQRGVLEAIKPVVRPLSEAPELESAFSAWSASRDAFQEHVSRTRPTAPADKWQKLYYRGVQPDGRPGPADHEAKLRLPPFDKVPAPRCPVRHGGDGRPRPAALRLSAEARDPDLLAFHLSASRRARVTAALSGKADDARLIARRRWLARVAERQRAISPAQREIARLRDLPTAVFRDAFYVPGEPVIVEGVAADWPAVRDWSPAGLVAKVGSAEVTFQGDRETAADFELSKDRHTRTMPFDRFIERATGKDGNDVYITAYNNGANQRAFAPLLEDLRQLPYLDGPEGMLWVGPSGTFTPLHHDLTNNLLVQVTGTKRLHLLPPSETASLANRRHVFSDVHDIEDPERLALYPAAAEARRYVVDLRPGDALFIPVGWWHQVRSLSFSVTLTYTNFLWPNDAYADFPQDGSW
ncbi:DUF6065 family protein [Sphingomonas sp. BK580]|uniref:DUF6065 family protein n=1 Tax=Sphingomonas sp. BK580 TaxID=2586972 RepID=UPI001C84351D|nr:DUF6065 family protein [Sphingomonas sp. BK580]